MNRLAWLVPLLSSCLVGCASMGPPKALEPTHAYRVLIDQKSADKLDGIIKNTIQNGSPSSYKDIRVEISASLLDTPYQANTLKGGPSTPEALVVNLMGVDCFTLLDYVEALSRSHDRISFINQLVRTRYVGAQVGYLSRRHFFSDWYATDPANATDVTATLGAETQTAHKQLNRKDTCNCEQYITGLGIIPRTIQYIPSKDITPLVLENIQDGDYVGVYSNLIGLDVSHVGLAVRHSGKLWFRNASSLKKNMKVVDVELLSYMHDKPGMVVLRSTAKSDSR